jgi:hypothetical protein
MRPVGFADQADHSGGTEQGFVTREYRLAVARYGEAIPHNGRVHARHVVAERIAT